MISESCNFIVEHIKEACSRIWTPCYLHGFLCDIFTLHSEEANLKPRKHARQLSTHPRVLAKGYPSNSEHWHDALESRKKWLGVLRGALQSATLAT